MEGGIKCRGTLDRERKMVRTCGYTVRSCSLAFVAQKFITAMWSGSMWHRMQYDHRVWIYLAQNTVRSQCLVLSGTEYGTVIGFGSIRYDHRFWIYLAQNTVRSQVLVLSGTEYGTILGFGSIRYRIPYDDGVWIYLAQYFARSCSLDSFGSWQSLVCTVRKFQTLKRNILTK